MKKNKALYFFVGKSSFVEKDTHIFSEFFEVKTFNFNFGAKWKVPFQLVSQFVFLIANIASSRICFIQLAGLHSLLPVLLFRLAGKKSVVIAGGTDCHSFPSIGYGNYQRPLVAFATRATFRNCTFIVPKHQSLWHTNYTYDDHDFPAQGIKFFNKEINKPYKVIPNGYDPEKLRKTVTAEPGTFITVSGLLSRTSQQKLKGIDLIIEAARKFPSYTFTIVGGRKEYFNDLPSNILLIPHVANNELPQLLSSHQYYLQLSMAEGFPNALCEAMLCECTPIGSDVFSIPEIIDNTGYILRKRDASELEAIIRSLPSVSEKGKDARNRISENYTLEKRRKMIETLVKNKFQVES